MSRKIDRCVGCNEVLEIAAQDLCFKCYRKMERKEKMDQVLAEFKDAAFAKERKRMLRGFNLMIQGMIILEMKPADVERIKVVVEPYIREIEQYMGFAEATQFHTKLPE